MIKKAAAFFFICLTARFGRMAAAQEQQGSLSFEHITEKNGLTSNYTTAIFQDSRRFIWTGTTNGLSRYDGKYFLNYNQIGEGGLSDRIVTCITEDASGHIWIGTESGLNRLNPFTNKITQYHEGNGPGTIPFRWCNTLFTDNKKQLWLTTEKGIALYDEKLNSFTNYPVSVFGTDEKINKYINHVAPDKDGGFWLSTSYGIKKFDPVTKQYKSYHKDEKGSAATGQNTYYGVCVDDAGITWAATFGGQLERYNAAADKFEVAYTAADKLMRFTGISSYGIGDNRALLITTSRGLLKLNRDAKNTKAEVMLAGTPLNRLFIDRQQNIWLSSEDGLFRHAAVSQALQWYKLPSGDKSFVYHIMPVLNSSHEYFLTTTSGWYRYNNYIKMIMPHILPPDERELLKYINRHTPDENGYWFTSVNGFGYYNIKSNRLTDLTDLVLARTGESMTGYITEPVKNQLWLTVRRSGILVYNAVSKKDTILFGNKEKADNVFGKGLNDLKTGPDGNVWLAAGWQLYKINPKTFAYKTYKPETGNIPNGKTEPNNILFTSDGRVIVSSGANIYELKNGKLELIYPAKGLFNFTLYRLIENARGELWAITDNGLYKTNKQFSSWKNMGSFPGMENEKRGFEIDLSLPGKIMMGSEGRIGMLDEEQLQQHVPPGPAIISRIRLGAKQAFLAGSSQTYRCGFKDAVEIELSAPDFINEKENKIFYRLQGWDQEWKTLTGQNTIRYDQLPPGSYSFSAKTVNADGNESSTTTIAFKVIPPFYRTWWFITLATGIIASGGFLFYRYRLRKAVELEKMRTRIATDLHDDIGATLSSIAMYSDALKTQVKENMPHLEPVLNKMGESSREMVTGMSDIVWAINPENDSGEKLLTRMENYATDMCAVKNIQLQFSAAEKINQLQLPLEHRKNIYLIFKEAINNAVKYSEAKKIWVAINIKYGVSFTMEIKDDGRGFDENLVRKGNGLKNFYLRAEEINGTIGLKSSPGNGTEIILSCPV